MNKDDISFFKWMIMAIWVELLFIIIFTAGAWK